MDMARRGSKAQASFEYIFIYGWATLIILGSISILYSFDLLNFNNLMGDKCSFYGQVECSESQVVADDSDMGNVTIVLQNDFGTDLNVSSFSIEDRFFTCEEYANPPISWPENEEITLNLVNCGGTDQDFVVGSRTDSKLVLVYYRDIPLCDNSGTLNSDCALTATGTLKSTIQKPYS